MGRITDGLKRIFTSKNNKVYKPQPYKCDSNIFLYGKVIAYLPETFPKVMDAWCTEISEKSGQKVDWSYFGGKVVVKAIGDLEKVDKAAYWNGTNGSLKGLGGAVSHNGYHPYGNNHWSNG